MNDESRELRYRLGALCERYNAMIADKDTLDYRLGSNEAYDATIHGVDAEAAYEGASHALSGDLRTVIVEIIDLGSRIREIERF
ncbi:MAG TPA: hypothetical protein VFN37_06605 [Candidatus Baltobacteraceae bacterium]|nr:hypothetical protein [Candidatus Baltobacteraceae bacterium]